MRPDLVAHEYRPFRATGILDFLHHIGVRVKTKASVKLSIDIDYLRLQDGVRGGSEPPAQMDITAAFLAKIKKHFVT